MVDSIRCIAHMTMRCLSKSMQLCDGGSIWDCPVTMRCLSKSMLCDGGSIRDLPSEINWVVFQNPCFAMVVPYWDCPVTMRCLSKSMLCDGGSIRDCPVTMRCLSKSHAVRWWFHMRYVRRDNEVSFKIHAMRWWFHTRLPSDRMSGLSEIHAMRWWFHTRLPSDNEVPFNIHALRWCFHTRLPSDTMRCPLQNLMLCDGGSDSEPLPEWQWGVFQNPCYAMVVPYLRLPSDNEVVFQNPWLCDWWFHMRSVTVNKRGVISKSMLCKMVVP